MWSIPSSRCESGLVDRPENVRGEVVGDDLDAVLLRDRVERVELQLATTADGNRTKRRRVRLAICCPRGCSTWRAYRWIAIETGKARDHIEHLPERIRKGRQNRPAMTREVFRDAVGVFDGTKLTFGNETFDLRQIRDSIRRVEEKVPPRLGERLTPKFSVTVDRPAEAGPD